VDDADDLVELQWELFNTTCGLDLDGALERAIEMQPGLLAYAAEWDQDAAYERERPDVTLGSRWVVYRQNDAQPYEARVCIIDRRHRRALLDGQGNGFRGWVSFDHLTEPSPYPRDTEDTIGPRDTDVDPDETRPQPIAVPVKHAHRWTPQGAGLPLLCSCGKTKRVKPCQ